MNELALFAGAGGGILAGKLLGWRTVCAVEWEPYPASVLCARQNDGLLPTFPVWDDVQTFDGRPWQGIVDVISGGFPCQDISVAGKGAGINGTRSGMWTHMARIIGEVRPRFVFVENSPALLTRGLGVVLGDLAALGYDCRWTVLGAADVGAPHQRDRFWLVAHANSLRELQPQGGISDQWRRIGDCGAEVADAYGERFQELGGGGSQMKRHSPGLNTMARLWPTPNSGSTHWGGTMQEWGGSKNWVRKEMPELASGALNPTWVEWLMGWPLGWTDLKLSATDKSPCVQQQHGES